MAASYNDSVTERRNNFLQKLFEIKANSQNCHTLLSKFEIEMKIEEIDRIKLTAGKFQ